MALAMIGTKDVQACDKASGSWQISFDPEISECGKPTCKGMYIDEYIVMQRRTG